MAQGTGFRWEVDPSLAFNQLYENYTRVIFVSGRRVAKERAEEAAQWMKDNHPWENVTGKAEAGLHVEVLESPGVLAELVFAHGEDVPHSIYLELGHGGSFGILIPAIEKYGAALMKDVQRIVNLGLAAK